MDLPATVAPFIPRGTSLLGIHSAVRPRPGRSKHWRRLVLDFDCDKLGSVVQTIGLDEVIDAGRAILDGKIRGRVVVEIC